MASANSAWPTLSFSFKNFAMPPNSSDVMTPEFPWDPRISSEADRSAILPIRSVFMLSSSLAQ